MSHLAFAFDWEMFSRELAPVLALALRSDATAPLEAFIEQRRSDLCDPNEGQPIPADWRSVLSVGDVQEMGDFALTKYYRPLEDFGVGDDWLGLTDDLSSPQLQALLGEPFGDTVQLFDPGRMGSYFQPPKRVAESLRLLRTHGDHRLAPFLTGLSGVLEAGRGVYVTF